jgi:hypothetical protein
MTRVALYARYSSDNQRDASIEDQLRICRENPRSILVSSVTPSLRVYDSEHSK